MGKALGFITLSLAASQVAEPSRSTGCSQRLPREIFLLAVVRVPHRHGRARASELGLSEAIGALMAGVVLSETSVREEIEERFFSFRDVFAALFFFVFGLSIDVGAVGDVGWIARRWPSRVTLVGKIGGGYARGLAGGFTPAAEPERRRRARRARRVHDHPRPDRLRRTTRSRQPRPGSKLVAFAGLYVLATATIGVVLMKESKAIGRRLFRPRLDGGYDARRPARDAAARDRAEVHAPRSTAAAGSP